MKKILLISAIALLLTACYPARYNEFQIPERESHFDYFSYDIYYPINDEWGVSGSIYSKESGGGALYLKKDPNHGMYIKLIKFNLKPDDFLKRKVVLKNFFISYSLNDSICYNRFDPKIRSVDSSFVSRSISNGYMNTLKKIDYYTISNRENLVIPFKVKEIIFGFDLIDNEKLIPVRIPLRRTAKIIPGVIGA